MNYNNDEINIKNALNTIETPKYDIMLEVEKKIKKNKSTIGLKKAIIIPLLTCLCLMFSIGVMAASIPSFNNILSIVSPRLSLLLQPLEISSEDKGIKMEVVGAMNDDEMAVIYLTMQDLKESRIDETLDIYDYSLTGAHSFNCEMVNYDEITKIATLRMQANGGKKLNGKKVSFSIASFLSDKLIFDEVETGVNISDITSNKNSNTIPLEMENISGGGGKLFKEYEAQDTIKVLKTDKMNLNLPKIDFMHISNIGYVDGFLHIQTKWNENGIDDHGYFYFVDTSGNKIDINEGNIYFGTDQSGNAQYGNDYIEYIFDVDNVNLNNAKLMGYFVSNGNYTKGDWKTTFKIQSVKEEKQIDCNIKFDSWIANNISISPLGITLVGSGENSNSQEITISANMIDGSIQKFNSVVNYNDSGDIKLKFIPSIPLDISKVKSVTVNENTININ